MSELLQRWSSREITELSVYNMLDAEQREAAVQDAKKDKQEVKEQTPEERLAFYDSLMRQNP